MPILAWHLANPCNAQPKKRKEPMHSSRLRSRVLLSAASGRQCDKNAGQIAVRHKYVTIITLSHCCFLTNFIKRRHRYRTNHTRQLVTTCPCVPHIISDFNSLEPIAAIGFGPDRPLACLTNGLHQNSRYFRHRQGSRVIIYPFPVRLSAFIQLPKHRNLWAHYGDTHKLKPCLLEASRRQERRYTH